MSERPSWDDFWCVLALMYSTRGTCDRLRTATILVKDKRLVGAGYNGAPAGAEECDTVGHLMIEGHCERTIHGENNAIINSKPEDRRGATAYIVGTPCYRCAMALINSGVVEIKYIGKYDNSRGKEHLMELARQTGVKITPIEADPEVLLSQAVDRLWGPGGALFIKSIEG